MPSESARRYAGVVLAAGASTRMGPDLNKLLVEIDGAPLVARPIDALLGAGVAPLVVVLGYEAQRVRAAIGDRACQVVVHDDWSRGMGASLSFGVRALGGSVGRGLFVCVADLPGLTTSIVEALIAADSANADGTSDGPNRICVPVYRGRRGHPVLFGPGHLDALARLTGEAGGRSLIDAQGSGRVEVAVDSPGILQDVDRPEDLAAWRGDRSSGV